MYIVMKIYNDEFDYNEFKIKERGELPHFQWMEDCCVATCNTYNEAFQMVERLKSETGETYALVLDNSEKNSYFVCPLGQAYECEKNFSGYEIIHKGTYSEMCQIEEEWNNRNIIPFGL